MDSLKNFFSQIDGRIFEIDFTKLGDKDYLFNIKPGASYFQSWAFVFGFFAILFSVLVVIFLKKRRNRLLIEKGKRHILSFHTKINVVFFGLFFILVFFRSQGMSYLSMRFLEWMSLGLVLINSIAGLVRVLIYKPESETESEVKTEDTYHQYLPKKKKKK